MGFLSSLFSAFTGKTDQAAQQQESEASTDYKGYTITPTPIAEGNQFRVSATISKGEGESLQTHHFIRSDVLAMREDCIELTIRKAQICIDQSGDNIFS